MITVVDLLDSAAVLSLILESFESVTAKYGLSVEHQSADGLGAVVMYANRTTCLVVGVDLREAGLAVDLHPMDASARPDFRKRVILHELVATQGGAWAEVPRVTDSSTIGDVRVAVEDLGKLVDRYAGKVLAGDWESATRAINAWPESAWAAWREADA